MSDELNTLYFDWLVNQICGERDAYNYERLLTHLHNRNFEWIRPLDENCAVYGKRMRNEFLDTNRSTRRLVRFETNYINFIEPDCSILELMVSLAIRMEDSVMSNDVFGDRTAYWFWLMIDNLGLGDMSNYRYNPGRIDKVLDKFINREYDKNGKGGLFVIRDKNIDMRTCDIWQQSMGFLRKFVENDGEIY